MLRRFIFDETGYGTAEMLVILAGVAAIAGLVIKGLSTSFNQASTDVGGHVQTLLGEQWSEPLGP